MKPAAKTEDTDAGTRVKSIAASSPAPIVPPKAKSLRNTYPQLRCAMDWRLKSKLDFVSKLHGVDMATLIQSLLEESLPALEELSRGRDELKDAWSEFDHRFSEAEAEAEARRRNYWAFDFEVDE